MALTSGDLGKVRESNLAHGSLYRFGQFVLDSRRRTLSRADSPVFLTPKAFDVLSFLVQNPNRLVTKEELLQAVARRVNNCMPPEVLHEDAPKTVFGRREMSVP